MRKFLIALVSLTTIASTTGCGSDDSTGPSNSNTLTEAQAISVASALFVEVGSAMANMTFSSGTATSAALVMPTFTFSGPCERGGSISGSGNYSTSSTTSTYDLTYTPSNCKVFTDRTYTINGDPNIRMNWSMPNSGTGNFTYTVSGGMKWEGGSCGMNYTIVMNAQTGNGTIKGTMCGISIDDSFSDFE